MVNMHEPQMNEFDYWQVRLQ